MYPAATHPEPCRPLPLPALPCSGPAILSVSPNGPSSGFACLEPPTQGTWVRYNCKACYAGNCIQAPLCNIVPGRRRLHGAGCATGQQCNLPNLEASTPYT